MGNLAGPRLWHQAWQTLPSKYKDILPSASFGNPEDMIAEVKTQITCNKGKPIILPNGSTFFIRDVLEKISHWVQRFAEVGDTIVQYDPGHAALPWAALRLLLQVSISNVQKHAAILEGIDIISRWLVWGKIQEATLDAKLQGYPDLEPSFVQLYGQMLTLIARSLKFLHKGKPSRMLDSFFSSESKFRRNIDDIVRVQGVITANASQMTGTATLERTQLLLELQRPIPRIEASVQQTLDTVNQMYQHTILDWTSVIPYEKHHKDLARKALQGTGGWLFQDPVFFNWQNSSSSEILWLHGGAGFGKSTLLSMIVQSLIQAHKDCQTPYPIYFYCSRNTSEPERSDAESILRSLVRQASDLPGGSFLQENLQSRYETRRTAGDISIEEASDLFLTAIADRPVTYLLIDALDECGLRSREALIEALQKILQHSTSLVKIFVASREYDQDIAISMTGYPELRIDAHRNAKDIETYVAESVAKAIKKRKLLPPHGVTRNLQTKIESSLCNGAQGMFRWVELQLEYLYTVRLPSVLLERLGKLPPGLEQSYEELYALKMRELGEHQEDIVRRLLSWLLVSQRPLTIAELRQLSLMEIQEQSIAKETILELCFSLVSLDLEQDRFRFAHPSVREFLEKKSNEFRPFVLHDMALSTCLDLVSRPPTHEAAHYAIVYWPVHAAYIDKPEVHELANSSRTLRHFLSQSSDAFASWCEQLHHFLKDKPVSQRSKIERQILECLTVHRHPCFVCASFGLATGMREMLTSGDPGNFLHLVNVDGAQTLYLASVYGHKEVVRLLLDAGAEVNARERSYGHSALEAASRRGHDEVVKLLLAAGAAVDHDGDQALYLASFQDHLEVVKLLLDAGADVNARRGFHDYALHGASREGNQEVVRLLLSAGAEVNSGGTRALYLATANGHEGVVKLLLDAGAEVNVYGGHYGFALYAASEGGFQGIVKLLLDAGADVNAKEDYYGSALQIATARGHSEVVEMLQSAGAKI